jgi:mono/diheme cytochrome c family protein
MTNADDKMHLLHPSSPILFVGKHMKKLAIAAAVAALCGAGLSAQPTATLRAAQTPSPSSPKPAASHPSTQLGAGPSTKSATATTPSPSTLSIDAQNKLVAQNCASCHSERMKAGELVLAGFDAAKIAERPDVAEKMIRKLRAGMMPPPGARRPDPATTKAFLDALETRMDAVAALNPNPGWRPFQRLNRAEYQHAVKDLLGIDVDVNAFLPPDTISRGFDNVADVQAFSPTLDARRLLDRDRLSETPSQQPRPARQRC